jgi:hypothetical protein
MDSIAQSSLISVRLFSSISTSAWSMFDSVMSDHGQRSCGSFSTCSLPSLKHLHHSNTLIYEWLSSPYCCWSLWRISAAGTFSPVRNWITMCCSMLCGTFRLLITLATPTQLTGSKSSRRDDGGCGSYLLRSHSCCAVRLFYTQICSHKRNLDWVIIHASDNCVSVSLREIWTESVTLRKGKSRWGRENVTDTGEQELRAQSRADMHREP